MNELVTNTYEANLTDSDLEELEILREFGY